MTITEPTVDQAVTTQPHPDKILPKPTREQVVQAICRQAGCTEQKAGELIDFLGNVLKIQRTDGYPGYHLEDYDIANVHDVMDVVMPDDARPMQGAGSAHDLVNRHLLDPDAGEQSFVHGRRGEEVRYCTLSVRVDRIG